MEFNSGFKGLSEGVVISGFSDTLVICYNFFIGLSGRQFVQAMSSTKEDTNVHEITSIIYADRHG